MEVPKGERGAENRSGKKKCQKKSSKMPPTASGMQEWAQRFIFNKISMKAEQQYGSIGYR